MQAYLFGYRIEHWDFVDDRDLQGWKGGLCLHDLPALRLCNGRALPHDAGLQYQPTATAAGRPPQEKMQALGTHLAEGSRLGSRSGLKPRQLQFTRLMKRRFRWWLSALLLYLLSVPIIFILIGLLTFIFAIIVGCFNQFSSFFSMLG